MPLLQIIVSLIYLSWSSSTANCSGMQKWPSLSLFLAVPPWLTRITEKICEESGLFPSSINHVLINEYLPNQGIMVCTESSLVHLQAFLHSSFSSCFKSLTSNLQYDSVYYYHLMSVEMHYHNTWMYWILCYNI